MSLEAIGTLEVLPIATFERVDRVCGGFVLGRGEEVMLGDNCVVCGVAGCG